ncbi:MAG: CrcB family protein [Actinomycetota bacterium]|nr:CrcB family protein [Actinomycetota bacterium]
MTARDVSGVVLGAGLGALGRWGLGEIAGDRAGLLLANIIGCLIISVATTRPDPRPWITAGWCGALTSFSGLALQVAAELDATNVGAAAWLLAGTAACCAGAFWVGRRLIGHGARAA